MATVSDMTERLFYLDLDAAADFWTIIDPATDAHAPSLDEWLALRLSQGQRMGSFAEYMRDVAPLLAQETESES